MSGAAPIAQQASSEPEAEEAKPAQEGAVPAGQGCTSVELRSPRLMEGPQQTMASRRRRRELERELLEGSSFFFRTRNSDTERGLVAVPLGHKPHGRGGRDKSGESSFTPTPTRTC